MQNNIKLICIGIFLNISLSGQSIVFEKVFNFSSNDALIDFIPTEDQGFVMIGSSSNNSFVMKLDLNGDLLWKNIIGTGEYYYQIIQTQNSDFIIAGQHSGDAILLRLSNSGDSISSILYPYAIENSFIKVIELENEDIIVSERIEQDGGNYPPRVFLRGFTSEGNLKWSQEIGDMNYPTSMILTEDKNILVTGIYDWWGWNGTKIWISKYDSLGNNLTEIIMDESIGNQIIESSNGYLYAAVDGQSSNGNYKAVKLDSNCVLEWKLNSNNGYGCYSNTICQLEPNRFAVGGAIQNSLNITIFDEEGDSIFSFNYNKYTSQNAKKMFCNQTSLTVGGIKQSPPNNNNSILVLQLLIDSLYTSNNSTYFQPSKTTPVIFPNPAETVINIIDFQITGEPITVSIFNINGELKILEKFEPGSQLNLNVELLNSGYYIAKITTNDKTAYCKFVIKDQSR